MMRGMVLRVKGVYSFVRISPADSMDHVPCSTMTPIRDALSIKLELGMVSLSTTYFYA